MDDKLDFRVKGVMFREGRLFGIITSNGKRDYGYDVDYLEKDKEYLYHMSSSSLIEPLPAGYEAVKLNLKLRDIENLFHLLEGEAIFCRVCDSFIDQEYLCEHIKFDEDVGWFVNVDDGKVIE